MQMFLQLALSCIDRVGVFSCATVLETKDGRILQSSSFLILAILAFNGCPKIETGVRISLQYDSNFYSITEESV